MTLKDDQNPSAFNQAHPTVGAQGNYERCLVVNVMDPLKMGRCQIRIIGHQDDVSAMPDNQLLWCPVQGSVAFAGMQTSSGTHGLLPGSMVSCSRTGDQDRVITGTLGSDREGANQSKPAQWDDKDSIHPDEDRQNQQYAWGEHLDQRYESKTTQEALKWRDTADKFSKRRPQDSIEESQKKAKIPKSYGQRTALREGGSGGGGVA